MPQMSLASINLKVDGFDNVRKQGLMYHGGKTSDDDSSTLRPRLTLGERE